MNLHGNHDSTGFKPAVKTLPVLGATAPSAAAASLKPADFLNLMITQLQHQDPLSPRPAPTAGANEPDRPASGFDDSANSIDPDLVFKRQLVRLRR